MKKDHNLELAIVKDIYMYLVDLKDHKDIVGEQLLLHARDIVSNKIDGKG